MTALAHAWAKTLTKALLPDGYNLLLNAGGAAGQDVFHAHLHITPRAVGDDYYRFGGKVQTLAAEEAAALGDLLRETHHRKLEWAIEYRSRRFAIAEHAPLVVGTDPACGLPLPDALIEPRHARFFLEAGEPWVEALGSGSETTAVNGQTVTRSRLEAGDRILVGLVVLKVRD
jgi:hypothetical protein